MANEQVGWFFWRATKGWRLPLEPKQSNGEIYFKQWLGAWHVR